MRTFRSISLLVLCSLLLTLIPSQASRTLAAVQPQSRGAALAADQPRLPAGAPCYNGALPPADVLCLVLPVIDDDGAGLDGVRVTLSFNDQSVTLQSRQLLTMPAGSSAVAFDVTRLGAGLADVVLVETQTHGPRQSRLIGIRPDPSTRTQVADPLQVRHPPAELSQGLIWGTVSQLDNPTPLPGVTVTLQINGQQVAATHTITSNGEYATFDFEVPADQLRRADLVMVQATSAALTQTVTFKWSGDQTKVPIIFGWDCTAAIPLQGGIWELPINFCLAARGMIDGEAVAGADVEIVTDNQHIFGKTEPITALNSFGVRTDIGPLISGKPLTTSIDITINAGGYIGTYSKSLEELGVGKYWGTRIDLPLIGERVVGLGLHGGLPGPLALARLSGDRLTTFVGGQRGGGLLVQYGASAVLRYLGNSPYALPSPEITALLWLHSSTSSVDHILAGTRSGELAISFNAGRSWQKETDLTETQAIVGLTQPVSSSSTIYALSTHTLYQLTYDISVSPTLKLQQTHSIPFRATGLAYAADQLYASADSGLWRSTDQGQTWTQVLDQPLLAVAAYADQLLLGTADGLSTFTLSGRAQSQKLSDVVGPVYAIATFDQEVRISTPTGIYASNNPETANWKLVIATERADQPTLGTPDVFDLVSPQDSNNTVLYAATSSGVYSSTDAVDWSLVAPLSGTAPLRSLAFDDNDDIIAISPRQLLRWDGTRWTEIRSLSAALGGVPLNGAIVRAQDSTLLVGRNAGAGDQLLVSQDNGATWSSFSPADNRDITAITLFNPPQSGVAALIATDGAGLFAWSPTSGLEPLPANGLAATARVASLVQVKSDTSCRLVLGTFASPTQLLSSPCQSPPVWSDASAGAWATAATNTSLISAIAGSLDRLFVATEAGLFQGVIGDSGSWHPVFGLPARPLALASVAATEGKNVHKVVVGGLQGGTVLLNDTSPDLGVRIVAPESVLGNTTVPLTLEVTNYGTVAARNTSLTFEYPQTVFDAVMPFTPVLTLSPGQKATLPLTAHVAYAVRPSMAQLTLSASMVNGERFAGNNTATESVQVRYRDGADPYVQLSGTTMEQANRPAALHVYAGNAGTQASQPLTLHVDLPAGMHITSTSYISPPPTRYIPDVAVEWAVSPLDQGEIKQEFTIIYSLPDTLPLSVSLPVTATFTPVGADRNLANNVDVATLRFPPQSPAIIVLTNWSRFPETGAVSETRALVNRYINKVGAREIALDGLPACTKEDDPLRTYQIPCLYAKLDHINATIAITDAANTEALKDLYWQSFDVRTTLNHDIAKFVNAKLSEAQDGQSPPTMLYIIGGDSIIPQFAYIDDVPASYDELTAEDVYASRLPQSDSLYPVMAGGFYASDWGYRTLDKLLPAAQHFTVSRSPGSPQAIAAVLQHYLDTGGIITIDQAAVAGYAEQLTHDSQRWSCYKLSGKTVRSTVPADCEKVALSASSFLAHSLSNSLLSLSGHASSYMISDLNALTIRDTQALSVSLALLLGCHSGLVPTSDQQDAAVADPSLVEAWSLHGIATIGFSAFAYADNDSKLKSALKGLSAESFNFAERLHGLLLEQLLSESSRSAPLTLAQAVEGALANYSDERYTALDWKTVRSFSLFGPPDYAVDISAQRPAAAPPQLNTPPMQFELTATYTPVQTPNGTFYAAQVSQGQFVLLSNIGETYQSAVRLPVPADVHNVVLLHERSTDIAAVDPVVMGVAPLAEPLLYPEPAYTGPAQNWRGYTQLSVDSSGQKWLTIALGSWSQDGTQHLIDSVTVKLLRNGNQHGR